MEETLKDKKLSRKKYIVSPNYQIKYVGIMLMTVLSTALFVGGGVYFTIMTVVNRNFPDLDSRKLFSDIVFSQANQLFMIALPLVLIAVIYISIFISHKISGPEYRLKRILDSMGRGDFAVPVKLRKGDELQPLADKIEDVNRSLSFMIKEQKLMIGKLETKLTALAKEVKKAQPSRIKLAALTDDLSSTTKKLKEDFESIKIMDV